MISVVEFTSAFETGVGRVLRIAVMCKKADSPVRCLSNSRNRGAHDWSVERLTQRPSVDSGVSRLYWHSLLESFEPGESGNLHLFIFDSSASFFELKKRMPEPSIEIKSRNLFLLGLCCLPGVWIANIFFRPKEHQREGRGRWVKLSIAGLAFTLAALLTWIIIFQLFYKSWSWGSDILVFSPDSQWWNWSFLSFLFDLFSRL